MTTAPVEPVAETTEDAPDAATGAVSAPEPPAQAPEPTELPPAPEGKVIELVTERGSLTLRPNQKVLDEEQKASLLAIGIDVIADPGVVPHLRAFVHMCQSKGLDPWAKEAYLIGRGKGDYRKWVMQVGIDGFRKMSGATGRFIRVKDVLWTGKDDDDKSYYRDENGVMRRVWYDQWPESRGYPGAAKAIIEHYDESGQIVETAAIADWGMYAPFSDKYEGYGNNKKKVIDPATGKPVQVLNEMWAKGYAHMLAKCAEALAHRRAFPGAMSGVFTHEEMHRADQIERNRQELALREARQKAYLAATSTETAPLPQDPETPVEAEDAVTVEDVPDEIRLGWLRAELDYQASVLGFTTEQLTARPAKSYGKPLDEFTADELATGVLGLRPTVCAKLAETDTDEADRYAALGTDVADFDAFMALDGDPEDADADADETDADAATDPEAEHVFTDDGQGVCTACGLREDLGPHPE